MDSDTQSLLLAAFQETNRALQEISRKLDVISEELRRAQEQGASGSAPYNLR